MYLHLNRMTLHFALKKKKKRREVLEDFSGNLNDHRKGNPKVSYHFLSCSKASSKEEANKRMC